MLHRTGIGFKNKFMSFNDNKIEIIIVATAMAGLAVSSQVSKEP